MRRLRPDEPYFREAHDREVVAILDQAAVVVGHYIHIGDQFLIGNLRGRTHAFVVEIEAQTRVGQDHVFIGVEHVHLVHQPFADHIAVPAAGTPREERRLLGGHRIVERHIGSVFAALENRIVRRIGENLVEFRHGEEALGLDIDLVFERRTHQQTQIDRVTQLAPFLDVSLVHVVLRSVEVLLRLRQQRIGLLE